MSFRLPARSSIATVLLLFAWVQVSAVATPVSWSVTVQPAKLVNGSPILFQITPSLPLKSLSASWFGHDVYFASIANSPSWYGIAGVSVETKPGSYSLELRGTTAQGKPVTFETKLVVAEAKYPSVKVTVPTKFTQPSAEELKEIAADKTIKQDTFSTFNPDRIWSGDFAPPVEARVSDVFGTARTFNGHVQGVHQGLDYAVPQGTPVLAINSGKVLLAQPLYFEGNCVVLDHGQGLLTIYMHLSKLEVKSGQPVERGNRLGLSGGTGRATGPHLHVAARWQGIYVDPAKLLAIRMP